MRRALHAEGADSRAQVADRSNEQPPDSVFRLLVAGQIVAASGFRRRRLYVEYRILYDPGLWQLVVPQQGLRDTKYPKPGTIRVQVQPSG